MGPPVRGPPIPIPFAYDALEYPTRPMRRCHPDRLFVVGRLFGLRPAPVETCRVLDVGCGTGMHLLAAAVTLPGATFVGLDLSETAIRRGRELCSAAGITNVDLRHADLMTFDPAPGSFDYVTAHGFYSWVPAPVRDRLFAVARTALTPRGLGYASFNAYPGCYLRRMFWDAMKYQTSELSDPVEKINHSKSLLIFLAAAQKDPDGYTARIVKHETDRLLSVSHPGMIYHDDLGEVNDPVYVHEFAGHLSRFGLRYLAEADVREMDEAAFPRETAAALVALRYQDVVAKEQYLDYLKLRRFRQSLFARAETSPASAPSPTVIPEFVVGLSEPITPDSDDQLPRVNVTFRAASGGELKVGHPTAKRVFRDLASLWPGRIPFADLADRAGVAAEDRPSLADLLWKSHLGGPVEFFGHSPRLTTAIEAKPIASPLARAQAAIGNEVSTLIHTTLTVVDDEIRTLLPLIDGTRDRSALGAELRDRFPDRTENLDERVESILTQIAGAGLLMSP